MVTEDQYIAYYENLAQKHTAILHDPQGKKSFFEVEDPTDLGGFDAALRGTVGDTVMLLVAGENDLDDAESESHTQTTELELYILQRKKTGITVPAIRSACMGIITDILARTKQDARKQLVVPGKITYFNIRKLPVRQVGPMNLNWYGYTALITFSCPFACPVNSGTWTDK